MFGPNPAAPFHHRGDQFTQALRSAQRKLLFVAGLDATQWRALIIAGSGTLALETVIASVPAHWAVKGCGGKFTERLRSLCALRGAASHSRVGCAFVQYETSVAKFNATPEIHADELLIVDAVSAFPYYPIPSSASFVVTCASKQLAGSTGIAVIFVRRAAESSVLFDSFTQSYLSLGRMIDYDERGQTPCTPAIEAINELQHNRVWARRAQIDDAAESLRVACACSDIQCDGEGPTRILRGMPKELATKWDLYPAGEPDSYQIFLWSTSRACNSFARFLSELRTA